MQGKNFDIFISYRRSDGEPIARIITETLKGKNYRCFLDYDKLKGGKFDERIEKAIKDAPIFIAVMTPDYLVRPKEDKEKDLSEEEKENQGEDWVYKEIEIANANNKYIISINHNKKNKKHTQRSSRKHCKSIRGTYFCGSPRRTNLCKQYGRPDQRMDFRNSTSAD